MPNQNTAKENAFNKYYSRFKLVIHFFDNTESITHYGKENFGCTVKQIEFKHVQEVMFDREMGFHHCLQKIDWCLQMSDKYRNIKTAIIYDNKFYITLPDGTKQKGIEVRKFVRKKVDNKFLLQLVESVDIDFTTQPKKILTKVVHLKKENGTEIFNLVPVVNINQAIEVDFKAEIQKAINKNLG